MPDHSALIVPLKTIAIFPGWSSPEDETGYVWFNAPLLVAGLLEPGFVLHGGAFAFRPEVHVSLELQLQKTPGRGKRPLDRIDWRSTKGGHSNQRRRNAPPGLAGVRVSNTHHHAFDLNFNPDTGRMKDHDLPYASEIEDDLNSFESLKIYAGKRFRISNIDLVQTPPWTYNLLEGNAS